MSQQILLTFYGQVKAKKNSKQIAYKRNGQPFVRSNDSVKAQERLLIAAFTTDFMTYTSAERQRFQEAEAYAITVDVWNQDRHRHDLDNQLATIMDALVKAGIIRDDNQEVVPETQIRYMGVDRLDPRAELIITTLRKPTYKE